MASSTSGAGLGFAEGGERQQILVVIDDSDINLEPMSTIGVGGGCGLQPFGEGNF
jgi:hypothetical protein